MKKVTLSPPITPSYPSKTLNSYFKINNAGQPLLMGEVAPKVTERGFEEIEVAPKVTERGKDECRMQSAELDNAVVGSIHESTEIQTI